MIPIYIPTFRRVHRQVTAKALLRTGWPVSLVAVPEEAAELRELGFQVLETPAQGIGPTRQWIINQHHTLVEGPKFLMMDDDLKFYARRIDEPTKFERISDDPDRLQTMLEDLESLMEEYPLVSLANRSGANRDTSMIRVNTRMHDMFGIDKEIVHALDFRIDRIRFMEDFDFILQHLAAGFDTAVLNTYCKDDYGSNAPGGCSVYRDLEGQAAAAEALAEMWPDFVKTRQVKAKGAGDWAVRTDVTVQWAKAAAAGKENLL